jgi:hypothetical protein
MVYIEDVFITYHNIYKIRPVPHIMDKVYYPALCVQPGSIAGIPFIMVRGIQTRRIMKREGFIHQIISSIISSKSVMEV